MSPRLPLLALALLVAIPLASTTPIAAHAQDDAGEARRIREEMTRLAHKTAWAGVDRKYTELVATGVPLSVDDHVLGAVAAAALGKTMQRHQRLLRAQKIRTDAEIEREIRVIDAQYGRIDLRGSRRYLPPLVPSAMPTDPEHRRSVEFASASLQQDGSFRGMLPIGTYKAGCTEIRVGAGGSFTTVTLERPPKQQLEACGGSAQPGAAGDGGGGGGGGGIVAGPVVGLGYSFMFNTSPADPVLADGEDTYQAQPQQIVGHGLGARLGAEVLFGDSAMVGVAAVGTYTGVFSGRTRYAGGSSRFHGGGGWLALTLRPGPARIAIGPTWTAFQGSGTGAACWYAPGPIGDGGVEDAPSGDAEALCAGDETGPNDVGWEGVSLGPGAAASVGIGLFEVGSLSGGVELAGGWTTDGVRQIVDGGLRIAFWPAVER